jgi:hypothetical protein
MYNLCGCIQNSISAKCADINWLYDETIVISTKEIEFKIVYLRNSQI